MKDLDGFSEFVAARLAGFTRLGYLLTGDRQLAEDLVQSALFKTAQRWRRVTDPPAYTKRVLVNESMSWFRRRRIRELPMPASLDQPSGEDTAEQVARRDTFTRALRRLTPKQRAVLALRFYEDMSESDTAEALGCAVGTVKSRTHQALARLREVAPELADLRREGSEVSSDQLQ